MIKLLLGLVKTSSAGMQQACSNSGTDAWSEMLPVHLLLCPTEGRPFPSSRCNLTPFASGAAAPAQGSLEGTSGWPGPIRLSPCRRSLGFLQQRRKREPGGTQGGDLGWVRGKMVHYLLLQRRLRAFLQGPRQDGWLRWCAPQIRCPVYWHCPRAARGSLMGTKRQWESDQRWLRLNAYGIWTKSCLFM